MKEENHYHYTEYKMPLSGQRYVSISYPADCYLSLQEKELFKKHLEFFKSVYLESNDPDTLR